MNDEGWPKYSQVAVSRTEDGSRIVRLDEAVAIAGVLDTSLHQMISPPESMVSWLEELKRQTAIMVAAGKNLNDAARAYEFARAEAWWVHSNIERMAKNRKAVKSLRESLDRELEGLADLLSFPADVLIEWVNDYEFKIEVGDE